jgi:hypothetical protein
VRRAAARALRERLGAAAVPCTAAVETVARITRSLQLTVDADGVWSLLVAAAHAAAPAADLLDEGRALLLTRRDNPCVGTEYLLIVSFADIGELPGYRRVSAFIEHDSCEDHCDATLYIRHAATLQRRSVELLLDIAPPD